MTIGKNIYNICCLIVFGFYTSAIFSQLAVEDQLQKYRLSYLPEKVFVHTDKNIYSVGETMWMGIYLVDGQTHRPSNFSSAIRVELHDQNSDVVLSQLVFTNDGHMNSDVFVDDSVLPGMYQLAVYTNNQRNLSEEFLFRKEIRILPGLQNDSEISVPLSSKIDVATSTSTFNFRFFPESGDCIVGIPCRVAVTVENALHEPLVVEGRIEDDKSHTKAIFKTNEFGIGTFEYQPQPGQDYALVVRDNPIAYNLPKAKKSGYHMTVQKAKDVVRFILNTNQKGGLNNSKLVLHLRGALLIEQEFQTKNHRALLDVPISDLDAGVVVATLFDENGLPQAERLFFVPPDKEKSKIDIRIDDQDIGRRQEVEMTFTIGKDEMTNDTASLARMSVSILPISSVDGSVQDDIRSWFLLNSDLDFPIHQSSDLIYSLGQRLSDKWIDDFLLTRGWRKFNWDQLNEEKPINRAFRLEQGVYVKGRMSLFDNETKDRPGKIFLTRMSNAFTDEVLTDDQGVFDFGPYELFDTVDIALNGRFKLGRKNRTSNKITLTDNSFCQLEILPYKSPVFPINISQKKSVDLTLIENYLAVSKKVLEVEKAYDGLTVDFENVDIKGKRIERSNQNIVAAEQRYGIPDARVKADDIRDNLGISPVFNILRRVAGVNVSGARGDEQIIIRGVSTIMAGREPLFLVDGVQTDLSGLRDVSPGEIDFVDVLKGVSASAYGSMGSNGVILVYTKRGNVFLQKLSKGLLYTRIKGYHTAKEFAVFDYDGKGNQNRPDFRTTLHWNGDIRSDLSGTAKETFVTSDQLGAYVIFVQGLRNDGQTLYGTGRFEMTLE